MVIFVSSIVGIIDYHSEHCSSVVLLLVCLFDSGPGSHDLPRFVSANWVKAFIIIKSCDSNP